MELRTQLPSEGREVPDGSIYPPAFLPPVCLTRTRRRRVTAGLFGRLLSIGTFEGPKYSPLLPLRIRRENAPMIGSEPPMPNNLIDVLPQRLENALAEVLTADEVTHIKLTGAYQEALICTSKGVVIVKAGLMTGNTFGENTFQMPYERIDRCGSQISPGARRFRTQCCRHAEHAETFWSFCTRERMDSRRGPNCVSLTDRTQVPRFRAACDFILSFKPAQSSHSPPSAGDNDFLSVLERLGNLQERGLLTDEEFQAKKSELLSGSAGTQVEVPHVRSNGEPESKPDDEDSNPEADAIIAKYIASRASGSSDEKPVFGKRRQ